MNKELQKVPEGYKQTEVGVIPLDWEETTIGQVTIWSSGGTPNRQREDFWAGEIPWISGSTLKSLEVYTSDQFLTKEGVEAGSKMAPINGTLLLVRGSALHNCIRAGLVISPVSFNQDVKCLFPRESVLPKYLTLYIMGMESELLGLVSSAGNSAGVLDTELVKKFKFFMPSINEQTAIANALSNVDALITSLEKLIAKKRAIKTAAMQQLLTGKKRLPPFDKVHTSNKQTELGEIPEDWEVKPLGYLCSYQNGTAQEQYFNEYDGYQVVSIGNYSQEGKFVPTCSYIDKSHDQVIKKFILNKGDLAMILNDKTSIGTIIGRTLLIDSDNEYVMNQRTMRLTTKGAVSSDFLHYLLNSNFIHKTIVDLAKPGTQIYVNTDDVTGLPLCFPVNPDEQALIVNVLRDMDSEIDVLDERLTKTQQIKQGMMQELLTGKTRLI